MPIDPTPTVTAVTTAATDPATVGFWGAVGIALTGITTWLIKQRSRSPQPHRDLVEVKEQVQALETRVNLLSSDVRILTDQSRRNEGQMDQLQGEFRGSSHALTQTMNEVQTTVARMEGRQLERDQTRRSGDPK